MAVPKSEDVMVRPVSAALGDFTARIGLNLGGRTYFSSAEDDFVNRLYRRSRPLEAPSGSAKTPRCQAEGCNADLTHAKHYHRRHKVCEFHSKAAAVVAAGSTQRFCQQCSRYSSKRRFCPSTSSYPHPEHVLPLLSFWSFFVLSRVCALMANHFRGGRHDRKSKKAMKSSIS